MTFTGIAATDISSHYLTVQPGNSVKPGSKWFVATTTATCDTSWLIDLTLTP